MWSVAMHVSSAVGDKNCTKNLEMQILINRLFVKITIKIVGVFNCLRIGLGLASNLEVFV